mmetsp:Transcript_1664/g.3647  ORF Transcript_1664/g.3647 Transcript_1664/m.3647 type:complete len:228 (-) Transcript_1664:749-1432(-)
MELEDSPLAATCIKAANTHEFPAAAGSSVPRQNDLASLSREHILESLVVLVDIVPMGDDRLNPLVQARDQERLHLVPCLEHLSAIDALQFEPLENNVVPIDGKLARGDAQQCHVGTHVQRFQHRSNSAWYARHLEADIEAFVHANFSHHLPELGGATIGLPRDVHSPGCAALSSQVKPIFVDVCNNDMAGPNVACDCHSHHSDRAGTCDKYILPHKVKAQCSVCRIA